MRASVRSTFALATIVMLSGCTGLGQNGWFSNGTVASYPESFLVGEDELPQGFEFTQMGTPRQLSSAMLESEAKSMREHPNRPVDVKTPLSGWYETMASGSHPSGGEVSIVAIQHASADDAHRSNQFNIDMYSATLIGCNGLQWPQLYLYDDVTVRVTGSMDFDPVLRVLKNGFHADEAWNGEHLSCDEQSSESFAMESQSTKDGVVITATPTTVTWSEATISWQQSFRDAEPAGIRYRVNDGLWHDLGDKSPVQAQGDIHVGDLIDACLATVPDDPVYNHTDPSSGSIELEIPFWKNDFVRSTSSLGQGVEALPDCT